MGDGEGELAPAKQVVRGGLLVLRAVAKPFAHELRREDAAVVPAMGNPEVQEGGGQCGAGSAAHSLRVLAELSASTLSNKLSRTIQANNMRTGIQALPT